MQNIVIVGVGEYYQQIVGPSLERLVERGELRVLALVDIVPHVPDSLRLKSVPYIRREPGQPLSKVLASLKAQNPVVLLGHANNLHLADATDLVANGFKVLIEKPYCSTELEMPQLKNIVTKAGAGLSLLEYYVMTKSAPLLLAAGKLSKNSFYITESVLQGAVPEKPPEVEKMQQTLRQILQKVKRIEIDVLEGEGSTGRLDQRGAHLSSKQYGGGMILDLAIHALAPLFAIQDLVGTISVRATEARVKIAYCKEHVAMAEKQFCMNTRDVAETYAEIEDITSLGVPLIVRVGKYILQNENQRGITFYGERGVAVLDLSDCSLKMGKNKEEVETFCVLPKLPESKYYPVVKAGLQVAEGSSPFTFAINDVLALAQEYVLNIRAKAYATETTQTFFSVHADPASIFS